MLLADVLEAFQKNKALRVFNSAGQMLGFYDGPGEVPEELNDRYVTGLSPVVSLEYKKGGVKSNGILDVVVG